jgi:hypothetical protein
MIDKYKKAFIETSQEAITPPAPVICYNVVITVYVPTTLSFKYKACNGAIITIPLNGDNATHPAVFSGCIQSILDTPPVDITKWIITFGDECS